MFWCSHLHCTAYAQRLYDDETRVPIIPVSSSIRSINHYRASIGLNSQHLVDAGLVAVVRHSRGFQRQHLPGVAQTCRWRDREYRFNRLFYWKKALSHSLPAYSILTIWGNSEIDPFWSKPSSTLINCTHLREANHSNNNIYMSHLTWVMPTPNLSNG